jgi:hypothetical protein
VSEHKLVESCLQTHADVTGGVKTVHFRCDKRRHSMERTRKYIAFPQVSPLRSSASFSVLARRPISYPSSVDRRMAGMRTNPHR